MINSQLITVFSRLSGTEKRALNKIVASPFFNHRQEVTDLWRYLVDHSKEGSPAYFKEKVFESVFPGEAYVDKKMRHVCSWLLQCIEDYLAYAEYKRTPATETLYRARAYKSKKLGKHFQKTLRTARQQLETMPHGPEYFNLDYQLEFEKFTFAETRKLINEDFLRHINTALDKYVLMSKLKQGCIIRAHRSVFTTDYDFSLVELLLDFLKSSSYLDDPGIACYYYCYRAISENNTNCFQALKKTLQMHQSILAPDDLKYLYFSSINFCIRKINSGVNEYRKEVFDLYKSGLKEGLLIEDGELSRFTYNNIVSTALAFEEFDWLDKFIPDYKPMLDPRYRESNYTYSLAKLNFTRKDYDKAMELLIKVDDRDPLINLEAKVILLKIYFEKKEFDPLTSLLSSFNVMLGRKKMLSYHKTHFQNIIRFTTRILNLRKSDKKAKEKLRLDIQNAKILGQREWLLEQLK